MLPEASLIGRITRSLDDGDAELHHPRRDHARRAVELRDRERLADGSSVDWMEALRPQVQEPTASREEGHQPFVLRKRPENEGYAAEA
jgi:hypothetical protein